MPAAIHPGINTMTPDEQVFYQHLGQRIAERRKAAGFTQVQLAGILGMAQQTLAHYEVGRLRMPVALLIRIADTLAIGIEELIGEEGTTTTRKRRGPEPKLARQIEQVRQLPRSQQQFVSQMIDTVLQQQRGQETARQKTGS